MNFNEFSIRQASSKTGDELDTLAETAQDAITKPKCTDKPSVLFEMESLPLPGEAQMKANDAKTLRME